MASNYTNHWKQKRARLDAAVPSSSDEEPSEENVPQQEEGTHTREEGDMQEDVSNLTQQSSNYESNDETEEHEDFGENPDSSGSDGELLELNSAPEDEVAAPEDETAAPEAEESNLRRDLAAWATGTQQTQRSLNELLRVLNIHGLNLPRDARTLLATPRYIDSQDPSHSPATMSEAKSTEYLGSQQGPDMVAVKLEKCSQTLDFNVVVKEEEEEMMVKEGEENTLMVKEEMEEEEVEEKDVMMKEEEGGENLPETDSELDRESSNPGSDSESSSTMSGNHKQPQARRGEHTYPDRQCGKSLASPNTLKKHQRKHTGEKSHSSRTPRVALSDSPPAQTRTPKGTPQKSLTPPKHKYPLSEKTFQRTVVGLLLEILDEVRREPGQTFSLRQLETETEFTEQEEELKKANFRQSMTSVMMSIGGKSARDCTNKMMDRCMTNRLMSLFNISGGGLRNKRAFGQTALYRVILEAVMNLKKVTEVEARASIGDHLKQAPGRTGGAGYRKNNPT